MRLLVQERLPVHAVDRVGAHVPCVYVMADRINQMKPLVLQKIGRRRGKEKDGVAAMPVGHNRHLHPQVMTVPRRDSTIHARDTFLGFVPAGTPLA